jgi:hypothetical protein
MVGAKGMPVGVQVMTHMWADELCTYIMGELEKDIKFAERHPCPEFETYVAKTSASASNDAAKPDSTPKPPTQSDPKPESLSK